MKKTATVVFGEEDDGFWGWNGFDHHQRKKKESSGDRSKRNSGSSDSVNVSNNGGFEFPLKQAATAGALALTGETIAQLSGKWKKRKALNQSDTPEEGELWNIFSEHDWIRALRMSSYGFLLYGPGSYAWYRYLDHTLPKPTATNLILKVLLNQVILGPSVIAVIFAWNNLWLGKISELGNKYQKDALPTLLYGKIPIKQIFAGFSIRFGHMVDMLEICLPSQFLSF